MKSAKPKRKFMGVAKEEEKNNDDGYDRMIHRAEKDPNHQL